VVVAVGIEPTTSRM